MKIYLCIDLKSFYASVECQERGLDPMTTNLVVADESRTDKTICLAVSPSLKQYSISGRARLFEVKQKVKEINYERKKHAPYHQFTNKTYNDIILKKHRDYELDFIIASPRMAYYIKYSTKIYNIYLKYLSEEDIFVYSIDEIFCDITNYLSYYQLTPKQLASKIIKDVYDQTGITATGGLGTNMYLAKVAMDILAKHQKPDAYGVRIAALDEMRYRKTLWCHEPLTDFWRVGKGYEKKLKDHNIYTMGDIARCSLNNEELLYKLFGINAELLIDHAWGYEPCTIKDVKNYKPISNSITSGQVLPCAYNYDKALLIVKEMGEALALDLVKKHLVTNKLTLTIGYDINNLKNKHYNGATTIDYYGRKIPKIDHGTINLNHKTSSSEIIKEALVKLYNDIVNKHLSIKRINITAHDVIAEEIANDDYIYEQFSLFSDNDEIDKKNKQQRLKEKEERKLQKTMLKIKNKYGKNAILKVMDLEEGATTIERNKQIGGHKSE